MLKQEIKLTAPIKKPTHDYEKAINALYTGQVKKFGKYFAVSNGIVYKTIITSQYGKIQSVEQNIVALKISKDLILGNSSILPLIGRTVSFGREIMNRDITPAQEKLGEIAPMLPFSVFIEAGLDLNKIEIIHRGESETINRRYNNPKYRRYDDDNKEPEFIYRDVHFTGAFLFRVEDKTFLFDIDRNEIKHGIFNAFLVQIPIKVKTINDAYDALKPDEVKQAESNGLKVRRQGEWFFIPTDSNVEPDMRRNFNDKLEPMPGTLRAGNNRPNTTQYYNGAEGLVKGKIEHSGREHKTIILKTWHKAVPNTAIESFTLTGDID